MPVSYGKFFDLRLLEEFSRKDSVIHRMSPEVKVISTFLFLILALSLGKYEIAALLPFFLYPLILIRLAGIPVETIISRSLIVLPFVCLIGIFNPLLDTEPLVHVGSWTLSGGWLSFFSIILRGLLTAIAALTLICTTGFPQICSALRRMGIPSLLTTQLLLLYHSLFILGEETGRMHASWKLRSFHKKRMPLPVWSSMIGHLFLRSLDRSGRLHLALLARGYNGELALSSAPPFTLADFSFFLSSLIFLCLLRFAEPALHLGRHIESLFP